jgi:hypothetical protein
VNGRLIASGIAMAVLVVWLARSAPVVPRSGGPGSSVVEPTQPRAPASAAPAPRLIRDPFRYLEEAPGRLLPASPAARPSVVTALSVPTAPEPIRLSGFVRRGAQLKAVLSVAGTTVVVAPGESADGYRVLSVDEDAGVRLRSPSGEELLLRPAGTR